MENGKKYQFSILTELTHTPPRRRRRVLPLLGENEAEMRKSSLNFPKKKKPRGEAARLVLV
ncbi:MAG: hypothetical protein AAB699_01540 [Patescibacteria group bacterium]